MFLDTDPQLEHKCHNIGHALQMGAVVAAEKRNNYLRIKLAAMKVVY
jgi:hypothetical protein